MFLNQAGFIFDTISVSKKIRIEKNRNMFINKRLNYYLTIKEYQNDEVIY